MNLHHQWTTRKICPKGEKLSRNPIWLFGSGLTKPPKFRIRYDMNRNTTNQCFGSASGMIRIQSGYWIRIQIRNPDPDPGGQKWPTKISKLQFLFNKILICFSSIIFLQIIFVIKCWIRIGTGNQIKCWIRIRIQWIQIHNTATNLCVLLTVYTTLFYQYKFYRIFGMPTALHCSTAGRPAGIPAQ